MKTIGLSSVWFLLLMIFSAQSQAQIAVLNEQLLLASPTTISANSELTAHMDVLAETAINEHCSSCHGSDMTGQLGVPNLVDYDWLWGVTGMEMTSMEAVMEIMQTIMFGVRDVDCAEATKRYGACPDTRFSQMPAYGELAFTQQQVSDLTQYVLAISGQDADAEAVARANDISVICTECHGEEGYGYKPYGGPDLTDAVWLYGGSPEQIYDVIYNGRVGFCPPWAQTLDAASIKALAVYLYNRANGF